MSSDSERTKRKDYQVDVALDHLHLSVLKLGVQRDPGSSLMIVFSGRVAEQIGLRLHPDATWAAISLDAAVELVVGQL
jgi:hypothetical protein